MVDREMYRRLVRDLDPAVLTDLDACWRWPGAKSRDGYGRISAKRKGKNAVLTPHRAMFEAVNGLIPSWKMQVCHRCDDRLCFNPLHLFIGSHQDNMRDMAAKGRGRFGKVHDCACGCRHSEHTLRKRGVAV